MHSQRTDLSIDAQPDDLESDRLRKDIMRTLSPIKSSEELNSPMSVNLEPPREQAPTGQNRDSSILPSEYDSYWKEEDKVPEAVPEEHAHGSAVPEHILEPDSEAREAPESAAATASNTLASEQRSQSTSEGRPNLLGNRFSWEQAPQAESFKLPTHEAPLPEPAATAESPALSEPTPRDAPMTKLSTQTTSNTHRGSVDSTAGPLRNSVGGLHIVNDFSALAPVDYPQRLSAESPVVAASASPISALQASAADSDSLKEVPPEPDSPAAAPAAPAKDKASIPAFRQILAMKSPQERIQSYNDAREQFANMNTGLSDWLSKTIAQNPEHASLASGRPPTVGTTGVGGPRAHKTSPSFSRFNKPFPQTSSPSTTAKPQEQGPVLQVPSRADDTTTSPSNSVGRSQGQKIGKDLLQTATVFGGKASSGAKGLLVKGRNKLRGSAGDKVD
ncbi:hypothetical protein LTS18_013272 [Coniosporium uncinatum]|uniref:Uncharacterized protein n=1 Tax=Coniosporium uncinatum TaxID=93489 RepID=A0ACC3CWM8_9PEZI|nr:hypothetical protein LTS18_013272 [Coniosporium uncinatum]